MLGGIVFLVCLTKTIISQTVTLSQSPTVDVLVNSPLTLTCATTYSMRFVFIKHSTLPVGNTAITLYNDGNGNCLTLQVLDAYEAKCDSVNGPYIITIKSVTRQYHNSKITCTIQYGPNTINDVASAETTILVNVPIVITKLTPSGTTTMNVSDSKEFQCAASGYPNPTISWKIDGSVEKTAAEPASSQFDTVTNTFTYKAQKMDNNKQVTCTASNTYGSVFNSTQLVIQYVPSVQVLPDYSTYKVIENTTNLQLQCNVTEANPSATTYRWYINDSLSPLSRNDPLYSISRVQRSDEGRYNCEASNKVGSSARSSDMILTVLYGVILNTIDSQQPTEGRDFSVNCTGQSNPTIKYNDVTWTKQNNNTFKQIGQTLKISDVNRTDSGIYICTVVMTLLSSNASAVTVTGMTTVHVDVIYQPVVQILPSYQPYNVIENTTNIQLNCSVIEAKPGVEFYLWKRNGATISSNATYTIPFVQNVDVGNYTCFGINKAGSSKPSLQLKLNVLYGVIIHTVDAQRPTEGRSLFVNCTGESFPPIEDSEIEWTKVNNNTFKHSGKQLIFKNVNRLDNGSYICTVKKNLTSSDEGVVVVTGSTTVTVNVLYLPMVVIKANKNVEILENSTNLILTCSVKEANPEVANYKWFKNGALLSHTQTKDYMVSKVYRSDAGYYICEGSNIVGASNSSYMYVNVLYGVTLNLSRKIITVNESENISLVCKAIGNPLPRLGWMNKYNNSILTEEDNVEIKTLNVNASCIDTGMYTCIGNNSIGDIAFDSLAVNVKCSPRTPDIKDTRTVVVNGIGGVLSISEVFISYPSSDVSWSRLNPDGNYTVLDNQFDISNNKSTLPYGTLSTLYKDGMQREEFGKYVANSVNIYGSFQVTYTIIAKGKPEPPKNISAICSITTITVIWMSMFNGGENQTFRIYIRDNNRNTTVLSSGDKLDQGEGSYITFMEESLVPNTLYEIYVEAKNSFGGINSSETVTCLTAKRYEKESTPSGLVGGIAGSISVLVVVCVGFGLIFVIRRRKTKGEDKEPIKREKDNTDEDEDGLKDNPLYVTSEQTANYDGVSRKQSANLKPDTQPMKEDFDTGQVYSKVEKIGQKGKKKKLEKKSKNPENGIEKKEKKKTHGPNEEIEMGTVYENSDKLLKDKVEEEVYANASSGNEISQTVNSGYLSRSQRNKDGLIYADLDLAPQQSGKRFIIRGLENRNNYAIIDLSKTAEPLPSDTEEEDTANVQNKNDEK